MMSSPSGKRETSVPRHQIITVSSLNTPIVKDSVLADLVLEDGCDVDVSHFVVISVCDFTDFDSSDEDIDEFVVGNVGFDVFNKSSQVFIKLNVESSIPCLS